MKSLDDVDGSTLYIFITFLLELCTYLLDGSWAKKPGRYELKTLPENYMVGKNSLPDLHPLLLYSRTEIYFYFRAVKYDNALKGSAWSRKTVLLQTVRRNDKNGHKTFQMKGLGFFYLLKKAKQWKWTIIPSLYHFT